ncbi:tyrosine-protein phosphatase [Myroides injenensis]|uniref:tyrosine-protein phosphatase n=1 Tax=Myroides injenensis TaxID=1183151 RepID=UPI000288AFA9|nr:tyrosine-protein phosphatase [Myroides injenensis]
MRVYNKIVMLGAFVVLQSCAYKTTYQPVVMSAIENRPKIVEHKKGYEAYLYEGDKLLLNNESFEATGGEEGLQRIALPNKDREMFTLVYEGDSIPLTNRQLFFRKVDNFRDMGGIETTENRTVKWGKLYRSGHLHKLKNKEFDKINSLSISTIIDLRTDREIDKKPDRVPHGVEYFNYQAYDDSEDMFSKTKKDVIKGKVTPEQSADLVKEFYKVYPTHDPDKVREIIITILDNDEATLFHCSAGKDRTGMIGAIILSILKVDKETILEEYLLSNDYRIASVSKRMKLAKFGKTFFPKLNYEVVENFSWIKPEYIQAMFEEIEEKYGSMDNYIEKALKITPEQRQQYITKFTD